MLSEADKDRFWRKVNKTSSCWIWNAYKDPDGYGRIKINGKAMLAHKVSLLIAGKIIPAGFEPDHICRNPACVNPGHLEPVTHKVNMLRGNGVGSRNAAKTHCKNGHLLTKDNLCDWPSMKGRRRCLICTRANAHFNYIDAARKA